MLLSGDDRTVHNLCMHVCRTDAASFAVHALSLAVWPLRAGLKDTH